MANPKKSEEITGEWGDGDPFADAVRAAAPGQAPPAIRARREGETESDRVERVVLWERIGLNEE